MDRLLERRLAALRRSCIEVTDEELDAGDSHAVLADHLRRVVREALGGVIGEDRLARQVELVNRILRRPRRGRSRRRSMALNAAASAAQRLASRTARGRETQAPDTPVALGSLLAGTRLDPSLVSQLRKELAWMPMHGKTGELVTVRTNTQ